MSQTEPMPQTSALRATFLVTALVVAACSGKNDAAPRADTQPGSPPAASRFSQIAFHPYPVVDRTQGGLVVGTFAVPAGWNATSNVQWVYPNMSWPVQWTAKIAAPDGSAWVEAFPPELFYWLEPPDRSTPVGSKSLGMIHKPGIGVVEAMRNWVLARYRGRAQNLHLVGIRPIPNLPAALGKPAIPGDSLAARVRYVENGHQVDEEFFALLTSQQRIPYDGPQGRSYEDHRVLGYVHSMGARDGQLDGLHPLLGFIVASFRPDPIWEQRRQQVQNELNAQYNRNLAAGYASIAAAGRLSRAISANNDAMIGMIESQRQAGNRSLEHTSDAFSQYIRGTERVKDPYYGTSEQDYTYKYHWTDGSGSYRHSNDAGFNPNIGSTGATWQMMEPVK